jgi:alpha-N-arabinofuranosidase
MIKRVSLFAGVLLAVFLTASYSSAFGAAAFRVEHGPSDQAQKDLIGNASFEEVEGNMPKGWTTNVWRGKADLTLDSSTAHSGKTSVRISSTEGGDASWMTVVPARPFSKYRLTGWVKTQNLEPGTGRGALFNFNGTDIQTKAVSGTQDWTRLELVFDSGPNDALSLNCLFGGWGRAKGTAWFDDVGLELLSARTLKPQVTIETAKMLAPMRKYIYGQFIEHLGRCIYQGIWAEMLEDRKFFYPVNSPDSLWRTAGDPLSVWMNPIVAYAGVPAVEVRLKGNGQSGGISQGDLALIKGKAYTGRIVLTADPGAAPVDVSLVWGDGPQDRQMVSIEDIANDYRTFPLSFAAGASTEKARLEISSKGSESFRIGAVSLMPADNVEGFRPEVLALLKELDSPVYRWPGGNFVSGYNWKDGVGDPDRRPPRKNPAWLGIEPNDVGIHEFMDLCRLIDTEPYITVNSGQGSEVLVAEEVEYVNGGSSTTMGGLRAGNGRLEPWGVKWWSVGNEMYGDWQLGHMPLADYIKKHNRFAEAMRAADPSIKIVAVGAVGLWSEGMLAGCAGYMDLISEHFYVGELPGLLSHVSQVPREVRRIAQAHRGYRKTIPELKGKDIPVALDEWNYWYGPELYGQIGTRYFLKDALGVAEGINEYARQADIIFMANYAQTVNVIGAIKTTKTAAAFDTTGLVLKLYRARFGTLPVRVAGEPEPLDVMAAWTEGKEALTISVVNPLQEAQALSLDLKGLAVPKTARLYRLAGADPMAYNEPGKEPVLKIEESDGTPFSAKLMIPPLSVSIYVLESAAK